MKVKLFWPVCLAVALSGCVEMRRSVMGFVTFGGDDGKAVAGTLEPTFDGKDAGRSRLATRLKPIASGVPMPTDIQAVPGLPNQVVVLSQPGDARLVDLKTGKVTALFSVPVRSEAEEGLLGLAFHPQFQKNRRFFLNYIPKAKAATRIAEWVWPESGAPKETRVLLEVDQPYQNHNGGQVVFGPDGLLYIGFGDGGWADDPHGHGQDLKTALGSMLRIDVDRQDKGKPYAVPADNPFVGRKEALPETWAYGLRNPWRYTFAPDGRMIVADVGQNAEEELLILRKGDNAGWDIMEGRRCHEPKEGCKTTGLKLPFLTYGRGEGHSITGGYVATGKALPKADGLYVFGDFTSGRIWALKVPEKDEAELGTNDVLALGKYGIMISTFGRSTAGDILVGAYDQGALYLLEEGKERK